MRLLKADFTVTGCEDEANEATKFTGIQIRAADGGVASDRVHGAPLGQTQPRRLPH